MLVDALGDYESMPDWNESADVLFGAGLTLNPSELHGAVAGSLAAGVDIRSEGGADRALALLEQALSVDIHGEVADFTGRLVAATRSAALDTDFAFRPLLPDDDEDFESQLGSVGRWCAGFLTGFTQTVSASGGGEAAVDPTAAEVLKDLAAIAQIDTSEKESEDAQREFEELVEYVRIAAVQVIQDAQTPFE